MLAPSRLPSARVRPSAPVCRVLTIALVKVCRFCTIDRLLPKAEAWLATVVTAVCRVCNRESRDVLLWNSVLGAVLMLRVERFTPAALVDRLGGGRVELAWQNSSRWSPGRSLR